MILVVRTEDGRGETMLITQVPSCASGEIVAETTWAPVRVTAGQTHKELAWPFYSLEKKWMNPVLSLNYALRPQA